MRRERRGGERTRRGAVAAKTSCIWISALGKRWAVAVAAWAPGAPLGACSHAAGVQQLAVESCLGSSQFSRTRQNCSRNKTRQNFDLILKNLYKRFSRIFSFLRVHAGKVFCWRARLAHPCWQGRTCWTRQGKRSQRRNQTCQEMSNICLAYKQNKS